MRAVQWVVQKVSKMACRLEEVRDLYSSDKSRRDEIGHYHSKALHEVWYYSRSKIGGQRRSDHDTPLKNGLAT